MSTFPVTTSTLSAEALGRLVYDHYELEAEYQSKLIRTGINHSYLIADRRTKFILRVYCYNWRTKAEIEAEIKLLNMLKENNISISYPIADQKGQFIQEIQAPEGTRYAVLFSYAEGGKVRAMDEEACFAVGSVMAKIHTLTTGKPIARTTYNIEHLIERPFATAKRFFSEDLPEMQFLKAEHDRVRKSFSKAASDAVQCGTVHLDIWYDNMSVDDSNRITIFDFDFCGNGWFVLDLAYFCKQLFHIEGDKAVYEAKARSFMKGYQSIRQISLEELQLIPDAGSALWIFYLGVQSQRFDWSNIFLTENYLRMFVGKMQSWMKYHQEKEVLQSS